MVEHVDTSKVYNRKKIQIHSHTYPLESIN